jgi:hypothetical protein
LVNLHCCIFNLSRRCSLVGDLPYWTVALPGRAAKAFKEERMKSLSDLADTYEQWAAANQARAEEILACQDSYAYEVREHQLWRASQLVAEAAALRKRAAELRKLEGGMVEIVQHGYKVPQDRHQPCERPKGMLRLKRLL